MKRILSLAIAVVFCVPTSIKAQEPSSTEAVVHAANDFLATLTPEQKQKTLYAFDDATQRAR